VVSKEVGQHVEDLGLDGQGTPVRRSSKDTRSSSYSPNRKPSATCVATERASHTDRRWTRDVSDAQAHRGGRSGAAAGGGPAKLLWPERSPRPMRVRSQLLLRDLPRRQTGRTATPRHAIRAASQCHG
jgi:hypothetical protein